MFLNISRCLLEAFRDITIYGERALEGSMGFLVWWAGSRQIRDSVLYLLVCGVWISRMFLFRLVICKG